MPGAGTDKTKRWIAGPAPVVILVEPQLGENIGATARAMANFGLSKLRLIKPVQGWPNEKARVMAAGADRILEEAVLYDSVEAAIGDASLVFAATARAHDQAKPVVSAEEAARISVPRVAAGETVALLFGRERNGLENHEVALADQIITLPVNPAFASLNLGQAVLVIAYEWFKHVTQNALPFSMPEKSAPAPKEQLMAFFADLERELERVEFFRPEEKRATMTINLRNIFHRMQPTQQDIQTLHGVVTSIVEGRKGPARGGVLDGAQAQILRDLLAEHGKGQVPRERGPVRGLSRLLRRNPTDAERVLWKALTTDRRFAGQGFKRQTPVGPHILDFVSFPLRTAIELLTESDDPQARAARHAWLAERGYRVISVKTDDVEGDLGKALDAIASAIGDPDPSS
ncbi:MAG TPA: TrmJ/YjtD family RNA methyltransferase [Pseudolabrys sp.]|nr:TrmJ/YjtD family RNA methyltransferase [Pseudolabrys sp.]